MRISHVLVSGAFAGTERYVCEVTAELVRRRHDVVVVGGSPDVMPALLATGVVWRPGSSPWQALRSLSLGGRCDIVHTHETKADFVGAVAWVATGGRQVSTRHILAPRGFRPSTQRLARVVRRRIVREVAVSEFVATSLHESIDDVLVNGLAVVPEVARIRDSRTVLMAQRLEVEKDTATAVRAWAQSGLGERGWRLEIAGAGPEGTALRTLSAQLGVSDSVNFLGWVADMPALYLASAVFLATAPAEPLGLSVLEAMARAVPVVATDAAGHRETVGRASAPRLFPVGDAQGCARLLAELAQDADSRATYGAELRALQRRCFSIEAHVDGLEAIYHRAGGDPAGPSSA